MKNLKRLLCLSIFGVVTANIASTATPAPLTQTVIKSFTGIQPDGKYPQDLVSDAAGNLFGVTNSGGDSGSGLVFQIAPQADGTYVNPDGSVPGYKVLHSFTETTPNSQDVKVNSDGVSPWRLSLDPVGNLFGVTMYGGAHGNGTIFEILRQEDGSYSPSGFRLAYNYPEPGGYYPGSGGSNQRGGVTIDSDGTIFGSDRFGGPNYSGSIFKISPKPDGSYINPDGTSPGYAAIYNFSAVDETTFKNEDGAGPGATLYLDPNGNLFGSALSAGPNATGTLYELSPQADGSYSFKLLHAFSANTTTLTESLPINPEGANPIFAFTPDLFGNLFSVTPDGGPEGTGSVFELALQKDGSYHFVLLATFGPINDTGSYYPGAGLYVNSLGQIFGTTATVNTVFGQGKAPEGYSGTVFKISPIAPNSYEGSVLTTVYSFAPVLDAAGNPVTNTTGAYPSTTLVLDAQGNLAGATLGGGIDDAGVVYQIQGFPPVVSIMKKGHHFVLSRKGGDLTKRLKVFIKATDHPALLKMNGEFVLGYGAAGLGGKSANQFVFKPNQSTRKLLVKGFTPETQGEKVTVTIRPDQVRASSQNAAAKFKAINFIDPTYVPDPLNFSATITILGFVPGFPILAPSSCSPFLFAPL